MLLPPFLLMIPKHENSVSGHAVSQVSTRLITFILNLLTARLLTIDAYGVRLAAPHTTLSCLSHAHGFFSF
jgi:hypothetical protein